MRASVGGRGCGGNERGGDRGKALRRWGGGGREKGPRDANGAESEMECGVGELGDVCSDRIASNTDGSRVGVTGKLRRIVEEVVAEDGGVWRELSEEVAGVIEDESKLGSGIESRRSTGGETYIFYRDGEPMLRDADIRRASSAARLLQENLYTISMKACCEAGLCKL
ncbi:hypothetical protein Tco_0561145 [Tanacetum coccineum]